MSRRCPPRSDDPSESDRSRLERGRTLSRVTFRTTDEQLAAVDSLVEAGTYHNRSEVIRAALRQLLEQEPETGDHR
ncbi:ribbon-helix-helix domain-containing protein [Halopiger djelfimassiliensis]|uniref:ribbon-helix-helix domain-containing protein n=1 Tax=Halopiger djelfimassiliensis TaxID=1293047 RepID=UPI000677AC7A|nr:ribbon-helix-helix domain-containing protein [Halopiger djelfimassiliensis]